MAFTARLSEERGQVLVMTVLSMFVLMGFMALAMDMGTLFRARRNMQIAADAAAMAGATQLFYAGTNAQIQRAAYAAATANGVDHTVTGNTVTVTGPGVTLPSGASCPTCVEVQLATPNPTFFMSLFTSAHTTNVAAMAVAGAPGASRTCFYVMDPKASSALWIHGAGAIQSTDCGGYVNSDSPDALCVTGNAGKSDLPWLDVRGQQSTKGNCKGTVGSSTQVNQKASPQSDPYAATLGAGDDPVNQCNAGNTVVSTTGQLTGTIAGPGYGIVQCYTYSVTSHGHSTLTPITMTGANMGPGIYVFLSGVNIKGTDVVGSGTPANGTNASGGALIEVADPTGTNAATYNQDTASSLTIYAPADSSSVYNGVALMMSKDETGLSMQVSFGSSGEIFDGMIYAPTAAVTLHDEGGGGVTATGLVAGTMYVNGSFTIENYGDFANNKNTTPFRLVTMVE